MVTSRAYDGYGNPTGVTVSSGVASTDPAYFAPRTTTTAYDARGQFPVSSTNALGQSEAYGVRAD